MSDKFKHLISEIATKFKYKTTSQNQISSTDLIANVAHEIRTPLTAMVAVLDNLQERVIDYTPQIADQLMTNCERLIEISTFLSDAARIDAGAQVLKYTEVAVGDWIEECIEPLVMLSAHKNLQFTISIEPDELRAKFDSKYLRQVVTNLVENAIKFSYDETVIQLRAYIDKTTGLCIEVANAGQVEHHEKGHIFDRFQTSAISPNVKTGGTGIGLALAKWVVSLHGGKISYYEDADSMQVVFKVSIPQ